MESNSEKSPFEKLLLIGPILKALSATGYKTPTPIQKEAIPFILNNQDILGIAQTGTGKTAAFCLPIIQKLYQTAFKPRPGLPRALVLAPTRELALQIQKNFETYSQFTKLTSAVVFGGVSQVPQVEALGRGVDLLVATTGRLLDLVQQRKVDLKNIEILVLDEADRMLDMGFFPHIHAILEMVPKKRQTLFFSATMPKECNVLAQRILKDPAHVEVTPEIKTAEKVEQSVIYVTKENKLNLLFNLLENPELSKVILFVEMKHVANRITEKLVAQKIPTGAIHSDKSQGARQKALEDFQNNKLRVLVATDIASRGIDVDGITHVINFDLSHLVENYVHRIGRTARAGSVGQAITLCTGEEKSFLFAIEKETRQTIKVIKDNPYFSEEAFNAPVYGVGKAKAMLEAKREANRNSNRGGGGGGRRGGGNGARRGGSGNNASSPRKLATSPASKSSDQSKKSSFGKKRGSFSRNKPKK